MGETRKIAAILVADIAGYSRLAGTDEDRTLSRLRGLRSDLIDPAIDAHHGRNRQAHRRRQPHRSPNNTSPDHPRRACSRRVAAARPATQREVMADTLRDIWGKAELQPVSARRDATPVVGGESAAPLERQLDRSMGRGDRR